MTGIKPTNAPACIASPAGTRSVLETFGLRARKKLGQHFLTDASILDKIIRTADIGQGDCVLEVGPGIGAVTQALAAKAGQVLAVELDASLVPVLQTLFADKPVTIHHGDILKMNIAALAEPYAGMKLKVVANLPYYVTTPVLLYLLECGVRFTSVTVMVQKEVAKRMAALPGTPDYGSLSLAAQYHAQVDVACSVPPACFSPRPAVDSAVAHLICYPQPPVAARKDLLFGVIRGGFNQRRKTLVNALFSNLSGFPKAQIAEALTSCGLPHNIRGEALSLHEFDALTRALYGEANA